MTPRPPRSNGRRITPRQVHDATTFGAEFELRLLDASTQLESSQGVDLTKISGGVPEMQTPVIEYITGIFDITQVRKEVIRFSLHGPVLDVRKVKNVWAAQSSVSLGPADFVGITQQQRYLDFAETNASAARTAVTGNHVHVNVHDPDKRVEVRDRMAKFEHVLMALTAASPIIGGKNSLNASERIYQISSWPSAVDLPPTGNSQDHLSLLNKIAAVLETDDRTRIHAFTRAVERFPTVEARYGDNGLTVDDRVFQVYLAAGLASAIVDDIEQGVPDRTSSDVDMVLMGKVYRTLAVKQGLDGQLFDPFTAKMLPAHEVTDKVLTQIRRGLSRIERLEGLEQGQIVHEFDELASATLRNPGYRRVLDTHRRLHQVEVAAGAPVSPYDAWLRAEATMSERTAAALLTEIVHMNHFGELIPGSARTNMRLLVEIDQEAGLRSQNTGVHALGQLERKLIANRAHLDLAARFEGKSSVPDVETAQTAALGH